MGKKNKLDIGTAFGVAAVVAEGNPNLFLAIFTSFMNAAQPEAAYLEKNGRRQHDQHTTKANLLARNHSR